MNDLITIIINCYKCEKYISKCLDSVINQTYKNIEILIIYDESPDNTLKICKEYKEKDKRIRIITTKNIGLSLSRNVGIENAKGEYLYFVDADDFIEEDTIEYLYNLIKKYNSDFATCKPKEIYNYNFKINNSKEKIEVIDDKEMLKRILLLKDKSVTTWNKLIKKGLYNDIRFEDRIINDIVVTHKLVIKAKNIVYSNQYKYFYYINSNSISYEKNIKTDRSIDKYNASLERYNYIKNIYLDLIENDIYLINNTISLYLLNDQELNKYLDSKNAYKFIKKLYTFKVFFYPLKITTKLKIILFFINKKLCHKLTKLYKKIKYRKVKTYENN